MSENRWQPVMVVADHRIECKCGNLAIFLSLEDDDTPSGSDDGHRDMKYWTSCQSCYEKQMKEQAE